MRTLDWDSGLGLWIKTLHLTLGRTEGKDRRTRSAMPASALHNDGASVSDAARRESSTCPLQWRRAINVYLCPSRSCFVLT